MQSFRVALISICLAFAGAAALASNQAGYIFKNIHYEECNDIELDFAGNVTAASYTGGPAGTNFPAVSGLGSSHIVLSGATMNNPGYSQYLFTFAGSPPPGLQHCTATPDGLPLGPLAFGPYT